MTHSAKKKKSPLSGLHACHLRPTRRHFYFYLIFAMKRCPIAAKIAGSIGILPCVYKKRRWPEKKARHCTAFEADRWPETRDFFWLALWNTFKTVNRDLNDPQDDLLPGDGSNNLGTFSFLCEFAKCIDDPCWFYQ